MDIDAAGEQTALLRAAERRLQAAQLSSDVDALEALLDDSLKFTGPDGAIYSKQDDLDAHAGGHQRMSRLDEEDLQVLVVGNTGVTWFLGTFDAVVGGQAVSARARYTRTWTRGDGSNWTVLAAHASFLAP